MSPTPAELFANNATTTLAAAITDVATSLDATSSAAFPAAVAGVSRFRIIIESEVLIVTNVAVNTWTLTRAAEGTVAAAHAAGVAIAHVITRDGLGAAINQTSRNLDPSLMYPQYGPRGVDTPPVGSMFLSPIFVPKLTANALAIRVTTAAATALYRLGIYELPATGVVADSKLLIDAGTVDCATVGAKLITISTPLNGGWYLLAAVAQTIAAAVNTYATTVFADLVGLTADLGSGLNVYRVTGVTGALPATLTGVAPVLAAFPCTYVRAA